MGLCVLQLRGACDVVAGWSLYFAVKIIFQTVDNFLTSEYTQWRINRMKYVTLCDISYP